MKNDDFAKFCWFSILLFTRLPFSVTLPSAFLRPCLMPIIGRSPSTYSRFVNGTEVVNEKRKRRRRATLSFPLFPPICVTRGTPSNILHCLITIYIAARERIESSPSVKSVDSYSDKSTLPLLLSEWARKSEEEVPFPSLFFIIPLHKLTTSRLIYSWFIVSAASSCCCFFFAWIMISLWYSRYALRIFAFPCVYYLNNIYFRILHILDCT